MKVFEILTYIGAAFGMIILFFAYRSGGGAPQIAASAAFAVAVVAIPYCVHGAMFRQAVVDDLDEERRDREQADEAAGE